MAHQTGESQQPAILRASVVQSHYPAHVAYTLFLERIKEATVTGNPIRHQTDEKLKGSQTLSQQLVQAYLP